MEPEVVHSFKWLTGASFLVARGVFGIKDDELITQLTLNKKVYINISGLNSLIDHKIQFLYLKKKKLLSKKGRLLSFCFSNPRFVWVATPTQKRSEETHLIVN